MSDQAPLPPNPPASWSASEFDKLIAALASKAGLSVPAAAKLVTSWRWTAGISPFDGVKLGLRDNLEGLVKFVNSLKLQADRTSTEVAQIDARVRVIEEAPAARPFP